jgi:hypothetical protein
VSVGAGWKRPASFSETEMPAFLDKSPSGLESYVDQNEDDEIRLWYQQDVEPTIDYAKALRNDKMTDSGIKRDMWLYAKLPEVVIMEMMVKHKVNVWKKEDQKKLFELLNTEYKYLKTTDLRHTVKKVDG